MSKRPSITSLPYGLEIIEGLMGAGKSYYAVRRLCSTIEETRRPVYTNLPLRWPVMRAYLRVKGGEELAGLIHPLKEKHWRAFLQRQHMHAQFREQRSGRPPAKLDSDQLNELSAATGRSVENLCRQSKIHSAQMWAWFHYVYGPDTFEGNDADSIPLGAIIIIDEVQHWHPMLRQGKDEMSEHLQAYLTMSRHHLHWIWVITQDRTRINILFRNLASSIWRVWDRGEDRIVGSLRFKHLGMRGMGYERFTREQLETRNGEDSKPSESFTVLPQLRSSRVYYRLYSSFTNVGSKRQIQKLIERTRESAGLSADGTTEQERKKKEEQQVKQNRKPPFHRRIIRRGIKLGITSVLLVISFSIGANINPKIVEQISATVEEKPNSHNWPIFNGIVSGGPILGGEVTMLGSVVGDRGELVYFDWDRRSCVLIADDGYWLWVYGQAQPEPVGTVETIRAAYGRLVKAENGSSGIKNDRATNSQTLESSGGQRDGSGNADSSGDAAGGESVPSFDFVAGT